MQPWRHGPHSLHMTVRSARGEPHLPRSMLLELLPEALQSFSAI